MPDRDPSLEPDAELMDVLLDRLGPARPEGSATPFGRVELLRLLRARRGPRRRRDRAEIDPAVAGLFDLVAAEPDDLQHLTPEIAQLVQAGLEQGLSREEMPHVFQAYVRAVGRVAAAEAASIRSLLADTPPEERAEALGRALDLLLPIGARGFDVMRRIMLLETVADEVATMGEEARPRETAIAMVDLVDSTRYLATSEPAELEALVDALFAASQGATRHQAVFVVKYVGDGVFLSGRDAEEVADVALDVIARLEATLPLRARGGLAAGTVLQRAGDVFGLPVNVAMLVCKAARPGRLLATERAASRVRPSRRGRFRVVDLPHPALDEMRVANVRPVAA